MASSKSVIAVIRASRPSFRNDHDKVAFLLHASFLSADYVLTATGRSLVHNDDPSSVGEDEVGTEGWNELEDSYAFLYQKTDIMDKKKRVLVKCLAFGDMLTIDAVTIGDGEQPTPFNLQIKVGDYVREGSSANYGELYDNLPDLVDQINGSILSPVNCHRMEEIGSTKSSRRLEIVEGHNEGQPDTLTSIEFCPSPSSNPHLPIPPFGASDAFPGFGAGMYPPRDPSIGGMLLGPNDPHWRNFGSLTGGLPSVPPGARFDPYGPPGVPGFEPNRFARNPRRPGAGTHPDLEHFSPF